MEINSEISAKYNICRYGNNGMQIHNKKGKVLFIANNSNDDVINWTLAVQFGEKNIELINLKQ